MTLLPWLSVAYGGLGPLDVVVLFNADDGDAAAVAERYAAARQLPRRQVCGATGVDPLATTVDWPTFEGIRGQLEACLAALPDPGGIDAIVTVRGLPYVVTLGSGQVGFEAALQVGRGVDFAGGEIAGADQEYSASVPNPEFVGQGARCDPGDLTVTNPYGGLYFATCALQHEARLPRGFERARNREAVGFDLGGELFVVTRLDGFDFADAEALVDRGVAADGTFPDGELLCMLGADDARGARDPECELATRRLAEAGFAGTWVSPHDPALAGRQVVGFFSGTQDLRAAIDGVTYAPGAIACNLTSYGALPQNFFCDEAGVVCPGSEAQTSIARFVRAGATGAHGTVFEPLNNPFPHAATLVLYASGYTLGESFLFAQEYLYWANLVLGDPLAAPFAERPTVQVPEAVTEGQPLTVTASHPDGVKEVRLYLDGALVASAEGDTVEWEHGVPFGDSIPLLAVAVAEDGDVDRPGWPAATQTVRAETQGWTVASVQVYAAGQPPGEEPEEEGCGCTGSPGAPWLALIVLVSRRRGSSGG